MKEDMDKINEAWERSGILDAPATESVTISEAFESGKAMYQSGANDLLAKLLGETEYKDEPPCDGCSECCTCGGGYLMHLRDQAKAARAAEAAVRRQLALVEQQRDERQSPEMQKVHRAWTAAQSALLAELLEGQEIGEAERACRERVRRRCPEAIGDTSLLSSLLKLSRASEAALRRKVEELEERCEDYTEAMGDAVSCVAMVAEALGVTKPADMSGSAVIVEKRSLANTAQKCREAAAGMKADLGIAERWLEERSTLLVHLGDALGLSEPWTDMPWTPEMIVTKAAELRKRLAEVEEEPAKADRFRRHAREFLRPHFNQEIPGEELIDWTTLANLFDTMSANFVATRKRLAEVEEQLSDEDEMGDELHAAYLEASQALDVLRTHFGIPEGEDVVGGVKAKYDEAVALIDELRDTVGNGVRGLFRASRGESLHTAVVRFIAEHREPLKHLRAYHNLPSDLPPMEVVRRSVGNVQEAQAAAEEFRQQRQYWAELRAESEAKLARLRELNDGQRRKLQRVKEERKELCEEVQALKADIQNREVNAREAVAKQDERVRDRLIRFAQWLQSDDIEDDGFRQAAAEGCVEQVDLFLAGKRPIEQGPQDFFAEDPKLAEQVSWEQGPGKVDREALARLLGGMRFVLDPEEAADRIVEWMEGRRG